MHLGWFATVPQLAAVLLDEGAQGMGAASVVVTPDPSQNALLKTRPAPVESSTSRLYPSPSVPPDVRPASPSAPQG